MNCFSRGREVRSRCKSVPSSSVTKYLHEKELSEGRRRNKLHYPQIFQWRDEDIAETDDLQKQVSTVCKTTKRPTAYVFVLDVLQQLQLSICPFTQDRCTERLHYLLDRNRGPRKLILS